MKTRESLPDDPRLHQCVLAYLSDFVPRRRRALTDDEDDLLARILRYESLLGPPGSDPRSPDKPWKNPPTFGWDLKG